MSSRTRVIGLAQFPGMLFECLLCSVHVFPGIDSVIDNVNVYLLVVMIMSTRVYVVGRFRFHHSTMGQAPGRFIAGLTHTHLDLRFLVRALLEYNPYSVTASVFVSALVMSSYTLRFAETVVCAENKLLQCTPMTFADAAWTLLITVTTVGYGPPHAPHSTWGRTIVGIMSVISFLVLAVGPCISVPDLWRA